MKFTIATEAFRKALENCAGAVERKSTMPILTHYKIEANGGCIRVSSSDLEVYLSDRVDCDTEEPGVIAVPADRLLPAVRAMSAETIEVKLTEKGSLALKAGRSSLRLPTSSADQFPETPTLDGEPWTIPAPTLSRALKAVDHAIANTESRYTLIAAYLSAPGGMLQVEATDGHMLARVNAGAPVPEDLRLLISQHAARLISKMAGRDGTVQCWSDEKHLVVAAGDMTLACRRISGTWPDTDRVIAPALEIRGALVDREEFIGAIKAASIVADERSKGIAVEFDGEASLTLGVEGDRGDFSQSLDCEAEPDAKPFRAGFNGNYLLACANSCDSVRIAFRLRDIESAGSIVPMAGAGAFRQFNIVMPMRIDDRTEAVAA